MIQDAQYESHSSTSFRTTFVSGDWVYGSTNAQFTNAYAQYAVAKASMLAMKPRHSTFIEAASVPVVAVTAWQMLFDFAKVVPEQTILVTGAAGSVGSFVLQFARRQRVRSIAVISSDDAERGRVDAVIDTSGGDKQRDAALTLKRGGVLVSSVAQPDADLLRRNGIRGAYFIVQVSTSRLDQIARRLDDGEVAAQVGTVLALEDARIAHDMLAGDRPYPRGKIVLDINGGIL